MASETTSLICTKSKQAAHHALGLGLATAGVLGRKVQHNVGSATKNAGGTTSKKRGGGAILYPILHLSQYHVTGGHTGKQSSKQTNIQIILGKTLQGVEGYTGKDPTRC